MKPATKTNGARFLDGLGISYELREYEVDPEDLTAITVAKKIAMPIEQVFKTLLVTDGASGHYFAVIPGDAELDFKKLARAAGVRRIEMVSLKEVQPLTGYIRGGVTVFGAKKAYPAFADETIELFDQISVSAGMRGVQIILSPADYLRASEATVADLTKDGKPEAAETKSWETQS
ncbi:MAG TPA: Cys-tRNA(Pro) deacylase [Acidobacteriaceae bacterium]|nr:Cys-tRNA(Pro) deacylase [Acidobacteriaceae bacterium]